GELGASVDTIDQVLACLDLVARWVDEFEDGGSLPAQADEDGRAMVERLRSFLPQQTASSAGKLQSPGSDVLLPGWASALIAAERDTLASRSASHPSAVIAISYEPIAGCFFNGDDPLQLMRQLPDL